MFFELLPGLRRNFEVIEQLVVRQAGGLKYGAGSFGTDEGDLLTEIEGDFMQLAVQVKESALSLPQFALSYDSRLPRSRWPDNEEQIRQWQSKHLAKVELLPSWSGPTSKRLARVTVQRGLPKPGEVIVGEGEMGVAFSVIAKGRVEVVHGLAAQRAQGWWSSEPTPSSARCRCWITPCGRPACVR